MSKIIDPEKLSNENKACIKARDARIKAEQDVKTKPNDPNSASEIFKARRAELAANPDKTEIDCPIKIEFFSPDRLKHLGGGRL